MNKQPTEVVNITLMDKDYQIKCPLNEKTGLLKAASFLEQRLLKIKQNTGGAPLEHTIMLAALNISYEHTQQKKTPELLQLNHKLKQLQQKLDQINKTKDSFSNTE